jgi:hypothetical protein
MTLNETDGQWIDIRWAAGITGTAGTEELGSSSCPEMGPTVVGDSGIRGSGSGGTDAAGGGEAVVDPSGGDASGGAEADVAV